MTTNPPSIATGDVELTILMPCLNEVRTLPACISKARCFLERSGVSGEILIADNGSTDGSQALAAQLGARVLAVPHRGYGAALIAGIEAARGRFVIFGDSDDSYDFSRLDAFVAELRSGAQLVMGNRFKGGVMPGAMPPLHRYLGNPVLSFIGRLFFKTPVRDFHCGLRGFHRNAMLELGLCCEGMEFASEMVVKASLRNLSIVEVPTTLQPDGRDRPPHLRSWRDGWRHLRFLLLFSPRWLYLYPGALLFVLGAVGLSILSLTPLQLGNVTLDVHTLLFAAAGLVAGAQLLMFAIFSKVFAVEHGILPPAPWVGRLRDGPALEVGLVLGAALIALGVGLAVRSVLAWNAAAYGPFDPAVGMRIVIPAATIATLGVQLLFSSMFLGVLGLRTHGRPA
ncbi:MAG: glycosyltransferase family 2 protein [Rubrivivax sp.]|nr:glycosyltransferase family 2 protein [Rubrivivax sp.]